MNRLSELKALAELADDQGTAICKTCVNEWANKRLSGEAVTQPLPTRDLNLELAAQQIRDLRNK